ncbi:MAG: DUF2723 domain-containing protein [Phycisphaerales bacterium]|nr:DUF2723 domain-containing protein [Phycisphaerales bacterium]
MGVPERTTASGEPGVIRTPAALARRRDYFLTLACAAGLYLVTVAPGPLWQDSGLAQLRVLKRDFIGDLGPALSHPLYYGLAMLFQALPFESSAYKTNLVSAVFAAIAVAQVYLFVALVTKRRFAGAMAAISLCVAHTFWQHAALAEVYSVSIALLVTELIFLQRFSETRRPHWIVLTFLLNGLGVSNHLLAILNLPFLGSYLIWLLLRKRVPVSIALLAGLAWFAGASLYLGILFQIWHDGAPLADVLRQAIGGGYTKNVFNLTPNLRRTVMYLGMNFPTPTALLALVGIIGLFRLRSRSIAAAIGAYFAIHLFWAMRYNVPDQFVFFIPAETMIAILIGIGAVQIRWRPWIRQLAMAAAFMPIVVYYYLPNVASRLKLAELERREVPYRNDYEYFLWPWKTLYDGAERFGRAAVEEAPAGAFLILDSTTVRPLHYLQSTEGFPKELTVWPPLDGEASTPNDAMLETIAASGRLFVVSPVRGYVPEWLLNHCEFEKGFVLYQATLKSGADDESANP